MKKYILDFRVVENTKLHDNYALLKLKPDNNEPLPDMLPGQFVEVRVDRSPGTFLRRPISINFVDSTRNELWLLIRKAGEGTRTLCDLKQGVLSHESFFAQRTVFGGNKYISKLPKHFILQYILV